MAAYDNVTRVKSSQEKLHHHHLSHSGDLHQFQISSQRKWRILVAIGLLLPALAAIIGIVAWSISIEVTSGASEPVAPIGSADQPISSRLHRKHLHQHHQHLTSLMQANHLQKQPAAPSSQQPLYRQFRRSQQQTGEPDASGAPPAEPVAARLFAISGQPAAKVDQDEEEEEDSTPASKKRKTSNKKTISERTGKLGQQEPLEELGDEQSSSSSAGLLLTNRNQLEALGSSSSTTTTTTTTSTTTTTTTSTTTEAPSTEAEAQTEVDPEQQQREEEAPGEEPPEVVETEKPPPVKQEEEDNSRRLALKTSRWSNGKAGGANKRPIKVPVSGKTAAKSPAGLARSRKPFRPSEMSEEIAGGEQLNASELATAKSAKSGQQKKQQAKGIKYIIVGKSQPSAKSEFEPTERTSREEEEAEEEREPASSLGSSSAEEEAEKESPSMEEVKASPPETIKEEEEPEKGDRLEDDQVSFEAIASAISTTLSAEQKSPTVAEKTTSGSEHTDSLDESVSQFQPSRRSRTAGEHVAEVIDHIVERRKQRQLPASRQVVARGGPQIVVVAPVSSGELVKAARSLTREEPAQVNNNNKKAEIQKKAEELKKKEALSGSGKKRNSPRPLGARLLGSLGEVSPPGKESKGESLISSSSKQPSIKYSERVEVIEDDDSSPLLMKAAPELGANQQQAPNFGRDDEEEPAEEERRQRENQNNNELQRRESLSMMIGDDQASSIHVASNSGEARSRSPRHGLPPGLAFERFAAVQAPVAPAGLFVAPSQGGPQEQQSTSGASQPKLYSAEQVIREHVMRSKLRQASSKPAPTAAPEANTNATSSSLAEKVPQPEAAKQQQVRPSTEKPAPPAKAASEQPKQQQSAQSGRPEAERVNRQQQQQPEVERGFGPGVQSVQVPMFVHYNQARPAPQQQPAPVQEVYQASESQNSVQQQQFAPAPSNQADSQLPLFADQEYNVPAHLADTVIQDIQRSPSTINLVNGQATLISSAGQVPHHQQQMQQAHQQQQAPSQQLHPNQLQPQQQVLVAWNPQVAASSQRQQMMLAAARQMAALNQHQQQIHYQLQHPPSQPQQLHYQPAGPVLANRAGSVELLPVAQAAEEPLPAIPARRGLGHPVAQFALRHLFQSLGQQALAQEAQHQQLQSRSMAPTNSQKVGPADSALQGLQPPGSGSGDQTAADSSIRQMRSLPPAGIQQQQQQQVPDQEVQESAYGPGYMQPHYQQQQSHYESSEHDKKSKGITFHFGGGPIGGGTQLITSPMGIFKHLMIPLLPNPRVNLNGKVVFGVVLEKTTAFGEPKKKYKFWG